MAQRPGDADNFDYNTQPAKTPPPVQTLSYEGSSSPSHQESSATPSGSTSSSSAPKTTSTSNDDSQLILPGEPQLWYNEDTKKYWIVYVVPAVKLPDGSTSGPFYSSWLVEDDGDLTALIGPGKTADPDFSGSTSDFTNKGVMDMGAVDELRNFDNLEGDPFDTWVDDMAVMAETRPWILDADYVYLVVQAAMERANAGVTIDEIRTTEWWREHTAAERSWMETESGDPSEAARMIADNRLNIRSRLEAAGINNATDGLVNFLADKATMGSWSLAVLDSQIAALSDPYGSDEIRDDLAVFMVESDYLPDQTQSGEDTVRGLLQTWLGPVYGSWSEDAITAKAGELRNDPDAEMSFVEYLKDQRMAMYPSYSDREVSYEAAARPWSTFLTNEWGFVPDQTDDIFQEVVQMNDPTGAGQLARRTGFDRGYEKVVNDVSTGITQGSASNVIGAV